MHKDFEKQVHNLNCGFLLNHTFGISAENSTSRHLHDIDKFLIYYFIKGSGNIIIEGNRFDIQEGDLVVLNPAEMFCCSIDKDIYHERLTLHINKSILNNFPEEYSDLFTPFFNHEKKLCSKITGKDALLYGLDKKIPEIYELAKVPTTQNKLLALCKVMEFFTELDKSSESTATGNASASSNGIINAVTEYLNRHFAENISIDSVAEQFRLSSSYLAHLFKEHMGISLWNYIIIKRINLFNELLLKGGSAEENCYKAGFQNYSNFFRLYKKYMKMTPLAFKKTRKA